MSAASDVWWAWCQRWANGGNWQTGCHWSDHPSLQCELLRDFSAVKRIPKHVIQAFDLIQIQPIWALHPHVCLFIFFFCIYRLKRTWEIAYGGEHLAACMRPGINGPPTREFPLESAILSEPLKYQMLSGRMPAVLPLKLGLWTHLEPWEFVEEGRVDRELKTVG